MNARESGAISATNARLLEQLKAIENSPETQAAEDSLAGSAVIGAEQESARIMAEFIAEDVDSAMSSGETYSMENEPWNWPGNGYG